MPLKKIMCLAESQIAIPDSFEDYVEPAIVRISSQFPDLSIQYSQPEKAVLVASLPENITFHQFKKDFLAILYRERIYSETLSIRKVIYGAQ